ncbi:MAG TPA: ABC transporter permease [Candidatus Limnocylindrales bacterium]|nr:ABC transporter permease [Candidatus Limnocylindrales bacterium]
MIELNWALDHLDDLVFRIVQHIELAAIPVGIGFAISLLLAIWAVRRRSVRGPIVSVSSLLYTIPSAALFAALVPVTGLEIQTAVIPLTLYTLLIYLRNMLAGLDGVAPDVIEAADAMGYGRWQRLVRVELPLALPLIVGGIRLASVSTIGLVTVSGILGDRFGGLGYFIFEGYRHNFAIEIVFGAVPTILLALAVDLLLQRVQRRLTPWAPRTVRAIDPGRTSMAQV